MSRKCWRKTVSAIIMFIACPILLQANCETKVIVFFDVSGSTASAEPIKEFLKQIREDNGPVKIEFIPFGVKVGASCGDVDLKNAEAEFLKCLGDASSNRDLNFRTTDLVKPFEELNRLALEVIPPRNRRVFAIFSDLRHENGNSLGESTADWLRRHRIPVNSASYELNRVKGQKLLLFLQEFKIPRREVAVKASRELADIATALGKNFQVAIVSETGMFQQLILDELNSDKTPLAVALKKIHGIGGNGQAVIEIQVENKGCFERKDYEYELRDTKGAPIVLSPLDAGKCLRGEDPCILPLPVDKLDTQNCHEKYSLRVVPDGDDSAAGETRSFTIDNCFEVKSIELDVAGRLNGAPHFQGCYDRRTKLKQNDQQEAIWTGWRKHDLDQQEGDVEFLACIEATGSLSKHTGNFTLKAIRTSDEEAEDSPEELSRVANMSMSRFMNGSLPDNARFFPVFFKLSWEEAREICTGAHELAPGNLYFEHDVTPGKKMNADRLLARTRNRDAEEDLHDLWESILIPVWLILCLVFFALRSYRHGYPGGVEGLLAVLGFGVAAWAAALHDATMLGNKVEKRFAEDPIFYTRFGFFFLFFFFVYLLWVGAFEPRPSSEVGVRIVRNSSLKKRLWRFGIRLGIWVLTLVGLAGFGFRALAVHPKEIESCHYTGFLNHRAAP